MQALTHEIFADQINKNFRIRFGEDTIELELTEVCAQPSNYKIQGLLRQPFTLIFQTSKDRLFPEGLYRLENEAIGDVDLYIIPIISVGNRQSYQAVFN